MTSGKRVNGSNLVEMVKGKRSQVSGFGFQVEGNSNNSDLIRACRRICLAISAHSRAYSVAGIDECWLADGISIFRQGWKKARNNPKPLNL